MQRINNITIIRNLISSLVISGRINTTLPKAKAISPLVDKLVTKMKKGNLANRRQVMRILPQIEILLKLEKEIVPKLKSRNSGYTRIVKIEERSGDNAAMARIEWIFDEIKEEIKDVKTDKTK